MASGHHGGLGRSVSRRLLLAAGGGGSFVVAPTFSTFTVSSAPNGGWVWFVDDRAIYYGGKTFFGAITGAGNPIAMEYVHATGITSTPAHLYPAGVFQIDDHDNPSFLRRDSDGRLIAGFTTHVGDAYANISTNPDDATVWDGPTNLTSQIGSRSAGQGYTYARLVQLLDEASDPVYMFFRWHQDADAPPGHAYLSYSKSTNGGASWGARVDVADLVYHKLAKNGEGRVDFVVSNHPFYGASSVYHFYYQGGTYYKSDGTHITASLPLAPSDLTRIYDGSTNRAWVWDIAIDPDTGYPSVTYVIYDDPYWFGLADPWASKPAFGTYTEAVGAADSPGDPWWISGDQSGAVIENLTFSSRAAGHNVIVLDGVTNLTIRDSTSTPSPSASTSTAAGRGWSSSASACGTCSGRTRGPGSTAATSSRRSTPGR
jgi:hypothetical protein